MRQKPPDYSEPVVRSDEEYARLAEEARLRQKVIDDKAAGRIARMKKRTPLQRLTRAINQLTLEPFMRKERAAKGFGTPVVGSDEEYARLAEQVRARLKATEDKEADRIARMKKVSAMQRLTREIDRRTLEPLVRKEMAAKVLKTPADISNEEYFRLSVKAGQRMSGRIDILGLLITLIHNRLSYFLMVVILLVLIYRFAIYRSPNFQNPANHARLVAPGKKTEK